MFPIIPYHLTMTSPLPKIVTAGDLSGSNRLLVPGRVTAACRIEPGVRSAVIGVKEVCGDVEPVQLSVTKSPDNLLQLDALTRPSWSTQQDSPHWLRAIRLADDCHSCNVQLQHDPAQAHHTHHRRLVLHTVRMLNPGDELLLWFSADILASMQMAFLTPGNIQGQKRYVCTRCSAIYESPNPLKIHMTLSCQRRKLSTLWESLLTPATLTRNTPSPESPTNFTFTLSTSPKRVGSCSPITIPSRSSPDVVNSNLFQPYASPSSAFSPFRKLTTSPVNNNTESNQVDLSLSTWAHAQTMVVPTARPDDAQIETLMSSLGKSAQGHVCLYCGKCYSRKYGLKIHIRTHTGYKPLKCKYCDRPFGDPSNLNKHVRLHSEADTPYNCDVCHKVLLKRRHLEQHLRSCHMLEMHPLSIGQRGDSLDTSSDEELTIH